ncbi:UbiE/COQ5 methyltransferase (macronuclear) [Tetrahymena thermophila SB210]|uniref:UbiE/COQ5 methyltransferase n=1 Tax=Tetrahymena thermophila (strain SB210) TaxID=312017 RepID=Q24E30_TETTS|nr:UbiE/COQ5 methyltransferase [Tetrahymena thermophila SB210]EAS06071.1 UbiE/COQ5 methyltransferase [Tetrahymena thermophila SB210]|eukprot:XP_001026316.1 UbiE/COQ5 methyltransferase [Tetrahymena thermophila SB210]
MATKSITEIEAYWDDFSSQYINMDNGSSLFYLSLINMLKIQDRKSILEVGAGAGFLFNHTMNFKKHGAQYIATDLSEKMLQYILRRLQIEEPFKDGMLIDKYNLRIQKANGEELPFEDNTFDCYIANLCLQITTDPVKMLKESHRVLQKGGVAGFSVWGDKEKSQLFTIIPQTLTENGCTYPQIRSNFHLNDREKLIKMVEDAGFTQVICWNQFSPYHQTEQGMMDFLNSPSNITVLQQAGEKAEEIKSKLQQKIKSYLEQNKLPFGLDGLLIIGVKN